MTGRSQRGGANPPDARADDLRALFDTFRQTSPRVTRRDLMRWSAVAAGAAALSRNGVEAGRWSAYPGAPTRFQDAEIATEQTITIPLDPYGQEVTLDPHRTVNWGTFWVMFPNVWGGLLRFDENGKVVYDLAESYTISNDGRAYTFKIRPDAKYANGRPVTAQDFVASWKRALNPSRPSPMVEFMSLVRGYHKYMSKQSEEIGLQAVDDATVKIILSRAYSYFPSYLAAFVWAVVDPEVIAAQGEEGFLLADAGTGPWRVTSFDPATSIVMEPNPNYYGGNSPSITKVVWSLITGPTAADTALSMYKQDEVISADVPLSLKPSVEGDPTLSAELVKVSPAGSTRSFAMDFNQEPFNDVRIRRALAHSIDRETFANVTWEGSWIPTTAFTPPVVAQNSGYEPPDGIEYDPDEAKRLLEEAGFANGQGLPPIVYFAPAEDPDEDKARWQSTFDQIKAASGISITLDTSKTLDQIFDMQDDEGGRQFDVMWWWAVTDTPHLMVDAFGSNSYGMRGLFNWSSDLEPLGGFDPGADSKKFDELVADADVEQDATRRNDLYRQAEELVLKNAVYVPIANWIQMYVQKPYVQGTKQGPWTGRLPVLIDKDVVVLKR